MMTTVLLPLIIPIILVTLHMAYMSMPGRHSERPAAQRSGDRSSARAATVMGKPAGVQCHVDPQFMVRTFKCSINLVAAS